MPSSTFQSVVIARRSTEVNARSKVKPAFLSARAAFRASCSPLSLRPTSTQPVNRFSLFQTLSPWRIRTSCFMAQNPTRTAVGSSTAQRGLEVGLQAGGAEVELELAVDLVLRLFGGIAAELLDRALQLVAGLRQVLFGDLERVVGRLHLDAHLVPHRGVEEEPVAAAVAREMIHATIIRARAS